MIAAMLLLLAPTPIILAEPAEVTAADSEILVIGKRYEDVRFKMTRNRDGTGKCRITRSSRDAAYDAGACREAVICMGTEKLTGEVWLACYTPRMEAFTDRLRAERRAAAERAE